jgi:hypothetical protein
MKFLTYYIDAKNHPQTIEANTPEMAAWKFVLEQPRADTSQVTVKSLPSKPWHSSGITHYRACDLATKPAPPDEANPEIAIWLTRGPEPRYVISGSIESLRLLGTHLLRALDKPSTSPEPKNVYGVTVVPGRDAPLCHHLSFEADSDIQRHWNHQYGFWPKYGRFLALVLFFAWVLLLALAAIGLLTVGRWIF